MIETIIGTGLQIIDKLIPDKKAADKAKLKLLELEQSGELKIIETQGKTIRAEVTSDSWMARNWRPIIMLLFGIILANNYIFSPWLNALGLTAVSLPIPDRMWSLLEIGLGGYIFTRGGEKMLKEWKKK